MAKGEISKTAKRSAGAKTIKKRACTSCKEGETIVVRYTGFGPLQGFRWTCSLCPFTEPS